MNSSVVQISADSHSPGLAERVPYTPALTFLRSEIEFHGNAVRRTTVLLHIGKRKMGRCIRC